MFYIWLGGASLNNTYWDRSIQNWTLKAERATLFRDKGAAKTEALHAKYQTPKNGEVVVRQTNPDWVPKEGQEVV